MLYTLEDTFGCLSYSAELILILGGRTTILIHGGLYSSCLKDCKFCSSACLIPAPLHAWGCLLGGRNLVRCSAPGCVFLPPVPALGTTQVPRSLPWRRREGRTCSFLHFYLVRCRFCWVLPLLLLGYGRFSFILNSAAASPPRPQQYYTYTVLLFLHGHYSQVLPLLSRCSTSTPASPPFWDRPPPF